MRVNDLITNMRYTLADPDQQRWTDARLVQLINEAQNDIAKRTKFFKSDYTYTFTGNTVTIDPYIISVFRIATLNGEHIPWVTQDELDRMYPDWRVAESEDIIQYIVSDRTLTGQIMVYPKITVGATISITATVVPYPVDLVSSDIQVPVIFDSAIMFYVTGRALRDDMDVQNRAIGNEQLQLYLNEIKQLQADINSNFKRQVSPTIKYYNPFNNWDK